MRMSAMRKRVGAGLICLVGVALVPQAAAVDDGSAVLPKTPTAQEQAHIDLFGYPVAEGLLRGPGNPAPIGPVFCPSEHHPTDGIIVAYRPASISSTLQGILQNMIREITTTGNARAYVTFNNTSSRDAGMAAIQSAGADMSRVIPLIRSTNAIWMRDYGPRYVYEGDVRVIINHTYNLAQFRAADNNFPFGFASFMNHQLYTIPLVHGGGNYHLNDLDEGFATRLINNENPSLSESQIIGYWQQFQGLDTVLFDPLPRTVDGTQHIDMWMQVIDDRKIIISDWISDRDTIQDTICNNAAAWFESQGWEVFRTPARRLNVGGSPTHFTYTNMVLCNDLVMIPRYQTSGMLAHNEPARQTIAEAMPDKTIVQIDSDALAVLAGVIHCIVMHVPEHRGGLHPTAYLQTLNDGPDLTPGQLVQLAWITDDDNGVVSVRLELSLDGGQTYPTLIQNFVARNGSLLWTVPDVRSVNAMIRVVATDAEGREGFDETDMPFTIGGPACPADFNLDAAVTVDDIFAFLGAWFAGDPKADFDGSGAIGVDDIFAFLSAWFSPCP